jgi:hypothetical protein
MSSGIFQFVILLREHSRGVSVDRFVGGADVLVRMSASANRFAGGQRQEEIQRAAHAVRTGRPRSQQSEALTLESRLPIVPKNEKWKMGTYLCNRQTPLGSQGGGTPNSV